MNPAFNRATLTDQVADALLDLIRERGLRTGDSLPATAEISQSFKVSRPVVREALAELAGRGLLDRQQGRETVLAAPGSRHLERLLRYRIDDVGIDYERLQQFRETIEVGAARLAALAATPADIADLRVRLDELRAARGEDALHDADVQFHRAVVRACDNDLFLLVHDSLTPLVRRLRRRVWAGWMATDGDLPHLVEAHATVLHQIEAHDPDGVEAAMRAHLRQAWYWSEQEPTEEGP